jgi:hypothetical protein
MVGARGDGEISPCVRPFHSRRTGDLQDPPRPPGRGSVQVAMENDDRSGEALGRFAGVLQVKEVAGVA